jgi:DNA-binding transcriptional regulator GbsR (MarR family)
MQQKNTIRKKMVANRKNNYFEISPNFFEPLIQLLKKKKKK